MTRRRNNNNNNNNNKKKNTNRQQYVCSLLFVVMCSSMGVSLWRNPAWIVLQSSQFLDDTETIMNTIGLYNSNVQNQQQELNQHQQFALSATSSALVIPRKQQQQQQQQYQYQGRRLELLHIPKTGGTMLEHLAAKHGIAWGACHFQFPWKYKSHASCPKPNSVIIPHISSDVPIWHYPLYRLKMNMTTKKDDNRNDTIISSSSLSSSTAAVNHYYDNLVDDTLRKTPKDFFIVIRNPYSRMISSFYMNYATYQRNNTIKCMDDIRSFNSMTGKWLRLLSSNDTYCHHACAFIPQTEYYYNSNQQQQEQQDDSSSAATNITNTATATMDHDDDDGEHKDNYHKLPVRHVLRLENITQEFDVLSKLYHLNMSVTETESSNSNIKKNANACPLLRRPHDWKPQILERIHTIYAKDFEMGNYPMISINTSIWITNETLWKSMTPREQQNSKQAMSQQQQQQQRRQPIQQQQQQPSKSKTDTTATTNNTQRAMKNIRNVETSSMIMANVIKSTKPTRLLVGKDEGIYSVPKHQRRQMTTTTLMKDKQQQQQQQGDRPMSKRRGTTGSATQRRRTAFRSALKTTLQNSVRSSRNPRI